MTHENLQRDREVEGSSDRSIWISFCDRVCRRRLPSAVAAPEAAALQPAAIDVTEPGVAVAVDTRLATLRVDRGEVGPPAPPLDRHLISDQWPDQRHDVQ